MVFGKVTNIAGVNQKLNFKIETAENLKSAREATEERIVALAANGRVLVFGLQISTELRAKFSKDIYVAILASDDQVRTAIQFTAGKSRGVLSLIEAYYIGIDIKFAVVATVVIFNPKILDRETVIQMAARGVRKYGDQDVYIYIVGSKHEQATYEAKIKDKIGSNFFDSAMNIDLVNEMMKVRLAVKSHKDYNMKADKSWKVTTQRFLDKYKSTPVYDALSAAFAWICSARKKKAFA